MKQKRGDIHRGIKWTGRVESARKLLVGNVDQRVASGPREDRLLFRLGMLLRASRVFEYVGVVASTHKVPVRRCP